MEDVREPADLVAVQADDELINALAGGLAVTAPGRGGYDADDHLAAMLAAWKADVDAEPIPEIDLDAAVGAVLAGRRPSGRMRHLVPVASAAALIVVAITGVSIAAHDARPGDALFSVSKVLYAEEAASYEALATVEESQDRARQALAVGDKVAAEAALADGQAAAENVLAEHGRGEVEQELHKLEVVVEETKPGVPTKVPDDEDEPAGGGGGQDGEEGTQGSTTSPHDPSSSARGTDSAGPGDEGSGSSGSSGSAGSADSDKPAPDEPGAGAEPGPSTEPGPDPRSGPAEPPPGPGSAEPSTASSAPDDSTPDRPKQPANVEPTEEASPPSDPPSSGTESSPETTGEFTTSSPGTTRAPASGSRPPGTSGISGASMSATGTATPSGEPTT